MLELDQKADVLMKYFRENNSQRAISREMKLSRTTIKKYINEYESKSNSFISTTFSNILINSLAVYILNESQFPTINLSIRYTLFSSGVLKLLT